MKFCTNSIQFQQHTHPIPAALKAHENYDNKTIVYNVE